MRQVFFYSASIAVLTSVGVVLAVATGGVHALKVAYASTKTSVTARKPTADQRYPNKPLGRDAFPAVQLSTSFGFNLQKTADFRRDIAMVRQAGSQLVRLPMMWWDVEKVRGQLDFSEYDPIMAELKKQGIRPVVCLAFGNKLYDNQWAVRSPEGLGAFARFAGAAAKRYQQNDVIWEIWNEPNLKSFWRPKGDYKEYMALVRATSPAIRAADPTALIIGPSLANTVTPFMLNCIKNGLLDYVDAVDVHPYQNKRNPEALDRELGMLRGWIQQKGSSAPVVFTEWGYSAARWREQDRADFIVRQALTGLMHDIPLNIWFNLHNRKAQCATDGNCYGILDQDYTPFPAYQAIQSFMSNMNGYRYVRRLETNNSKIYCLLFAKGKKQRVVTWTAYPTSPTVAAKPKTDDASSESNSNGDNALRVNTTDNVAEPLSVSLPNGVSLKAGSTPTIHTY